MALGSVWHLHVTKLKLCVWCGETAPSSGLLESGTCEVNVDVPGLTKKHTLSVFLFCFCRLFPLRTVREANLRVLSTIIKLLKASWPALSLRCSCRTLRRPLRQPPQCLQSRTWAPFMSPRDSANCWKQVPQSIKTKVTSPLPPHPRFPHPQLPPRPWSPQPPFPPPLL